MLDLLRSCQSLCYTFTGVHRTIAAASVTVPTTTETICKARVHSITHQLQLVPILVSSSLILESYSLVMSNTLHLCQSLPCHVVFVWTHKTQCAAP